MKLRAVTIAATTAVRPRVMLFLLLLFLQLLPSAASGMLKAECPLNLRRDYPDALNYYKPGDHIISGLISTVQSMLSTYNFSMPPQNVAVR